MDNHLYSDQCGVSKFSTNISILFHSCIYWLISPILFLVSCGVNKRRSSLFEIIDLCVIKKEQYYHLVIVNHLFDSESTKIMQHSPIGHPNLLKSWYYFVGLLVVWAPQKITIILFFQFVFLRYITMSHACRGKIATKD